MNKEREDGPGSSSNQTSGENNGETNQGNSETDYIPFSPFILDFGNFVLAGSFGDLSLEIITEAFEYITEEDTVIDKIDNGYVVKFTATSGEKVTGYYISKLGSKAYRNDYSSATVYGKKNVEESWVTELQAENRVEKIWDLRQNNKLVVSTLLKSSYNDSGEIVYEVNNPIKEQVFQY